MPDQGGSTPLRASGKTNGDRTQPRRGESDAVTGDVWTAGEPALAKQFLMFRACWLAVGLVAILREPDRYRKPWLARLGWALSAGEFAWLLVRLRRRTGFLTADEATVDAAVGATSCAASVLATNTSEQLGELTNWAFSAGLIAASTGPIASPNVARTLSESTGAATLYGAVGMCRRGADRHAVLANAVQYFGWWAGGQTFAAQLRGSGARIAQADAEAAQLAHEVAAMRERERIQDQLYGGAVRALKQVRGMLATDRQAARSRAAAEALRLRHGLRDPEKSTVGFEAQLGLLAIEATRQGTRVEVFCDAGLTPDPEAAQHVLGAAREVVARLPAGAVSPVIIRASEMSGALVVTIRYRGEGLSDECRRRLEQVGRSCRITVASARSGVRVAIESGR